MKLAKYISAAVALSFVLPTVALAADGSADVDSTAFYAAMVGAIVPALAYVINHYAPWVSEPVKATVFAVVGAGAGIVTQLLDNSSFGFNTQTLKIVVISMTFAFLSHMGFWKPSTLSTKLGGGSNHRRSLNR